MTSIVSSSTMRDRSCDVLNGSSMQKRWRSTARGRCMRGFDCGGGGGGGARGRGPRRPGEGPGEFRTPGERVSEAGEAPSEATEPATELLFELLLETTLCVPFSGPPVLIGVMLFVGVLAEPFVPLNSLMDIPDTAVEIAFASRVGCGGSAIVFPFASPSREKGNFFSVTGDVLGSRPAEALVGPELGEAANSDALCLEMTLPSALGDVACFRSDAVSAFAGPDGASDVEFEGATTFASREESGIRLLVSCAFFDSNGIEGAIGFKTRTPSCDA